MDYKRIAGIVRLNEGLRLKPYHCTAGKLTIGYGRNLEDVGITAEEAEMLLYNDLAAADRDLKRALPWVASLDAARQEALLDMAFNLGISRLLRFKKMLAALQEKDWEGAANQCLDSTYARQVGARAHRNAHALKHGVWLQ